MLRNGAALVETLGDILGQFTLDGEGGHMVYGKLVPAQTSLAAGGLPIGLAHGLALRHEVAAGQPVRWEDVAFDETDEAIRFRRTMERAFAGGAAA